MAIKPDLTALCPHDCGFRIIAHTPGLWECLSCHQIWDRPERGTRVWTPSEQARHRDLWADALDSGKYPQGREYLRRTDSQRDCDVYTPTGVAADVCPFTEWQKGRSSSYAATSGDDLPNFLIPTLTLMNWLGLSSPQGHFQELPDHPHLVGDKMSQNNLVHLNDHRKVPFKTIAVILRSNPPGIFL